MQPGGSPSMQQILQQAQKMQQQMAQAQAELAVTEVTGSAGGGAVVATMLGNGDLQSVVISPDVVDPDDVDTLGDLVTAAVRDAQREVAELARTALGPVTDGLGGMGGGLGLPGL